MEQKQVVRNIACSLALQVATIISGFVIPKIILIHFGSAANGVVASINQVLNYIQLLEGGLSSVIMASLYEPLAQNDTKKINAVVNAAQSFFKKIALIYVIYVGLVAFLFPIFKKTGYSYKYSVALILVLAMNLFVQYYFSLAYRILLNADRKVYIVSMTQFVIVVTNLIAVIIAAKYFNDILIIKFTSALVFFIQPIVFGWYIKKHYKIEKTKDIDHSALSQRWAGFGINLAYFVHTNTDIIILTVFSTFEQISVYNVYLMVITAIKSVVLSISHAIVPSFGKVLVSSDKKRLNDTFELYEFGIYFITTIIFTCGMYLMTPFIRVYTNGITDVNYEQYVFGYLLTMAEMFYCLRDPHVSATYSAGHFKPVTKYAYIEVVINLIISLLLVRRYGIIGVAAGTLVSMFYRQITHVYYLRDHILERSVRPFWMKTIVFGTMSFLIILLSNVLFDDHVTSYIGWLVLAIKNGVLCLTVITAGSYLFFRKSFMELVGKRILRN